MKVFNWVIVFVLVGLVGWLAFQNDGKERELVRVNGKLYELLSHQVDTVTIEIIKVEYRRGRDIEVIVEVPTYVPVDVDTLEILKDYYSKRIYSDTLRIDSLGYIAIRDTISENRIVGRGFDARISERTILDRTVVKELPKVEFYMGGSLRSDVSIGGIALLKLPSRTQFGVEVGFSTTPIGGTPYIGGMILWPIK